MKKKNHLKDIKEMELKAEQKLKNLDKREKELKERERIVELKEKKFKEKNDENINLKNKENQLIKFKKYISIMLCYI